MKIIPEHVEYIRSQIAHLDTQERREDYIERGYSDKRYRWDLVWKAKLSDWIVQNIYKYAHDEHLDTALRTIVKPLDTTLKV